MDFPDRRTLKVLLTILVFVLALAILYVARGVIITFVFAILLAYLIDPVVRFLQTHSLFFKNLRGPHVLEAYLAFLVCLAFIAHAIAPRLISFNTKLLKAAPAVMEGISTGEIAETIGEKYHWEDARRSQLKQFLIRHQDFTQKLTQDAERLTSKAVVVLVVVPILSIFFLAEGRQITDAFIRLLSTEKNHQAIREVADELNLGLRAYIRAKVILVLWSLAFYSTAMLLLRFPHAIALGVLGSVLEFIPLAGWIASAATFIIVGVATHSHWIWMAILLGVWRLIMDYLISPRVVGHNLEVHPLLVIFAVMVGGEIDGIVGIYLSIPAIVVARAIWQTYLNRRLGSTPELVAGDKNLSG
jgi:predicted PurR-regulated permease PerM